MIPYTTRVHWRRNPGSVSHDDVYTMLAEIERLETEIKTLDKLLDQDMTKAEIEKTVYGQSDEKRTIIGLSIDDSSSKKKRW
jgi:hypothetical protein